MAFCVFYVNVPLFSHDRTFKSQVLACYLAPEERRSSFSTGKQRRVGKFNDKKEVFSVLSQAAALKTCFAVEALINDQGRSSHQCLHVCSYLTSFIVMFGFDAAVPSIREYFLLRERQ